MESTLPNSYYTRALETLSNAIHQLASTAPRHTHDINSVLGLLHHFFLFQKPRILMFDAPNDKLTIHYGYNLSPLEIRNGVYHLGEGITGKILQTGRSVLIRDVNHDLSYIGKMMPKATLPRHLETFMAVPLYCDGYVVGVLAINTRKKDSQALANELSCLENIAAMFNESELFKLERPHLAVMR